MEVEGGDGDGAVVEALDLPGDAHHDRFWWGTLVERQSIWAEQPRLDQGLEMDGHR